MKSDLLDAKKAPSTSRSVSQPIGPIPKVADLIGQSLHLIGPYKELDNKKQVVALIDDVRTLLILFIFIFPINVARLSYLSINKFIITICFCSCIQICATAFLCLHCALLFLQVTMSIIS